VGFKEPILVFSMPCLAGDRDHDWSGHIGAWVVEHCVHRLDLDVMPR
jgi:hypothetical protein